MRIKLVFMGDVDDEIMRGTSEKGISSRGTTPFPKKGRTRPQKSKKLMPNRNLANNSNLSFENLSNIDLQLELLPAGSAEWNSLLDKKKEILAEKTQKEIDKIQWLNWPSNKKEESSTNLKSKTYDLGLEVLLVEVPGNRIITMTRRIVRAIGVYETNRGGIMPKPKESIKECLAGVKASVRSIVQTIVSRAITGLHKHVELRQLITPPLLTNELKEANNRIKEVYQFFKVVCNELKNNRSELTNEMKQKATSIGFTEVEARRMFEIKTVPKKWWGENKAAWGRLGVIRMHNKIGQRIISAAEHNGGLTMALADIGGQVNKILEVNPTIKDDELVIKVAKNHNSHTKYYPAVLRTYQRLYPAR